MNITILIGDPFNLQLQTILQYDFYKLFYSIYYLASQYMIPQKLSHFSVTDLNIGYFCATHRT
jgi:hypothetical protein